MLIPDIFLQQQFVLIEAARIAEAEQQINLAVVLNRYVKLRSQYKFEAEHPEKQMPVK